MVKTVTLTELTSKNLKADSRLCGEYGTVTTFMGQTAPVVHEGVTTDAYVQIDQYFTDAEECRNSLRLSYGTLTAAAVDCSQYGGGSGGTCPKGCKITGLSITADAPNSAGFTFTLPTEMIALSDQCAASSSCVSTVDTYWTNNPGVGDVNTMANPPDSGLECGSTGDTCPANLDWPAIVAERLDLVATVCDAWNDNPPYQCSTFERLSIVSIFSQSFALTSTAVGFLYLGVNIYLNHFYNSGGNEGSDEADVIDEAHLTLKIQPLKLRSAIILLHEI